MYTLRASIMNYLILLLAVGSSEAALWQKLTCPFGLQHEGLWRVWCRQSSTDCCSGLAFSHTDQWVEEGGLRVTHGPDSFTVAVLKPDRGEGIYWCGVLSQNGTVIKLAEGYFYSCKKEEKAELLKGHHTFLTYHAYIWSFTRWILLPLFTMVTTFMHIYSRKTSQHRQKREEEPDDDDDAPPPPSRAPADPHTASLSVLER